MSRKIALSSANPSDYLGVYKSYDEVPDRYRLYHHQTTYEGEDVWSDWLDGYRNADWIDRTHQEYAAVGEDWQAHMAMQNRHHALPTPEHVNSWVVGHLATKTPGNFYTRYWSRLCNFLTDLLYDVRHPHVYNPMWMAARNYPESGQVWEEMIRRTGGSQ